jgi:hypothetical protein
MKRSLHLVTRSVFVFLVYCQVVQIVDEQLIHRRLLFVFYPVPVG